MIVINILLAVLGLTATLAAFGGETWKKGDEPLIQRITKRGYLSLFCLVTAFILGITREVKTNQQKEAASLEAKLIREENKQFRKENLQLNRKVVSLNKQIGALYDSLNRTSESIKKSANEVTTKVDENIKSNCEGLEKAFKLAINIPRDYDDYVININGRTSTVIPGRITDPMELYWGDSFEYTFIPDDEFQGDISDLASLKLRVGNKNYELHPGTGNVFHHGNIRIYGADPRPMTGYIINPNRLSGIKIKIFVRSTDATRGQQEFRRIVLQGQCSEFARRLYKVTNTDIVRLRAQASKNAPIRSSLVKGSFVRTLQMEGEWTEVTTPENRQGWIKSEYLSMIK